MHMLNVSQHIKKSRRCASAKGFTIVELLIVIVVIAILAAISIVAYAGIQNRANDASVTADLRSISQQLEVWKVGHESYPLPGSHMASVIPDPAFQVRVSRSSYAGAPVTNNNLIYCYDADHPGRAYGIIALSRSGNAFWVASGRSVSPLGIEWSGAQGTEGAFCAQIGDGLDNAVRGYAAEDSTYGPWRSWVGAE